MTRRAGARQWKRERFHSVSSHLCFSFLFRNFSSSPSSLNFFARASYIERKSYGFSGILIHSIYHLLVLQSVLRKVRGLLPVQFSTVCGLVRALSYSSTLSFIQGHPVAAHFFFLIFLSLLSFLSFSNVFQKTVPTQNVISLVSFLFFLLSVG